MPAPKIALRKVANLVPDPENARTHSPEQVENLVGLIDRFGWTSPILADDMIRAGHGRRLAALAIYERGGRIHMAPGRERGGVELPDGTVPILDCTGWTEEERRAFNIADNRIAEQAGWDYEALARQLGELVTTDLDLALVGFDSADLAQMMKDLAPPAPPEEFPEFDEDIPVEHKCPKCNYTWSGKSS